MNLKQIQDKLGPGGEVKSLYSLMVVAHVGIGRPSLQLLGTKGGELSEILKGASR